jgi:hypothetical protein
MRRGLVSLVFAIAVVGVAASAMALDVKPTGRIYANFNYNLSGYPDWDERYGENDFAEFELARAYMGVKASFTDEWSAVVVGDVSRSKQTKVNPIYDEDTGELLDVEVSEKKGAYTYYVKYAFGQYQPFDPFGFRIGIMNTPYIDRYEKAWGYRYVEKTPSDRVGWDASSDLGFAFLGEFPGGTGSYYGMLRNGEGYKNPEVDSGKGAHVRVVLTPFQGSEATKNLQLTSAYEYERQQRQDPEITAQMFNGLLSYKYMVNKSFGFNLGAGYDWLNTATDVDGEDAITSAIAHGYGVIYMPYHLALFGRVDLLDPDTENDEDTHGYQDESTYILGGISIDPVKNISFALDVKTTMYTEEVVDDQGEDVSKPSEMIGFLHSRFKF